MSPKLMTVMMAAAAGFGLSDTNANRRYTEAALTAKEARAKREAEELAIAKAAAKRERKARR